MAKCKVLFPQFICSMYDSRRLGNSSVPRSLGCVAAGREHRAVTQMEPGSKARQLRPSSWFPNLVVGVPLEVLAQQDLVAQQRASAQDGLDGVGDFHLLCRPWPFPGWGFRVKLWHIRCSQESFQHLGWFYLLGRGRAGALSS